MYDTMDNAVNIVLECNHMTHEQAIHKEMHYEESINLTNHYSLTIAIDNLIPLI